MSVGIFVFQTGESVDSAILAKHAEELGFESFWVPEHAIIPVQTTSPEQRDSHSKSCDRIIEFSISSQKKMG